MLVKEVSKLQCVVLRGDNSIYLVRDKLAKSFASKKKDRLWSEVKRLKSVQIGHVPPWWMESLVA